MLWFSIGMAVFGFLGLMGLAIPLYGDKKLVGSSSRIVGGILLFGALLSLLGGAIGAIIFVLTLFIAISVGLVLGKQRKEDLQSPTTPVAEPLPPQSPVAPLVISGGSFLRCPVCQTKNYGTAVRCEKCGVGFLPRV